MKLSSILYVIITALLLACILPTSTYAVPSDAATYGFKIDFYNMDSARVQYLQVLSGNDAAKLRADIDINYGNNDGKVTSSEVDRAEAENSGEDSYLSMAEIINVQVNKVSGDPNFTLEILDAEGSIVSQDPVKFNIYIDLTWNPVNIFQVYTLNITCLNATLPSYFFLTIPSDLFLDMTTLYPQLLRTYAGQHDISVSESEMPHVSNYFAQTLTMDIPNPYYTPPPDNDQDGSPDDTDLDDDNDGMPDTWEDNYVLDPFTDDADQDADGDGYTNYEEFRAGSIPTDPGSKPAEPEGEEKDNTAIYFVFLLLVIIMIIILIMLYRKKRSNKK